MASTSTSTSTSSGSPPTEEIPARTVKREPGKITKAIKLGVVGDGTVGTLTLLSLALDLAREPVSFVVVMERALRERMELVALPTDLERLTRVWCGDWLGVRAGKTTLLMAYTLHAFLDEYTPTGTYNHRVSEREYRWISDG